MVTLAPRGIEAAARELQARFGETRHEGDSDA